MVDNYSINNCTNICTEDRLSALPNSLLLEILTLLPLKNAAATSTLSHRWRHLWTHLSHLHYSTSPSPPPQPPSNDENLHKLLTTVTHILTQHSSPHINTFDICYYGNHLGPHQSELCTKSLTSWVPFIYAKSPLHFLVSFHFPDRDDNIIALPSCVLDNETLTTLDLSGFYHCKMPQSGVVNLPNLKTLRLWGLHIDLDVLKILFKSCPLLEDLSLILELDEDEVIEIIAKKLRDLYISMSGSSNNTKFVIDAPLLEEIWVAGCVANYSFVRVPCMLHRATIALWPFTLPQGSVLDLVRGISSVNSMQIMDSLAIFRPRNDINADLWSVFDKLTHLTLIIEHDFGLVDWNAPIPVCMLSRLKGVELFSTKVDDNDMKLVKCIMRNANVLEKLSVYCHDRNDNFDEGEQEHQLWKEFKFCGTLFRLSRRSLNCEITFDGHYIKASGDDEFRNGPFASQIHWYMHRNMWPNIEEDGE